MTSDNAKLKDLFSKIFTPCDQLDRNDPVVVEILKQFHFSQDTEFFIGGDLVEAYDPETETVVHLSRHGNEYEFISETPFDTCY